MARCHSDCAIPTPKADAAHSCSAEYGRYCRFPWSPHPNSAPDEAHRALPSTEFPSPHACQPRTTLDHGLPLEPPYFSRLKSPALAPLGFPNHASLKFQGCWCEPEPPEASCG